MVVEGGSLEALPVESSGLLEVHSAGLMEQLFRQYQVSEGSIHLHQTWSDQRLMNPMEILAEAQHFGNSLLLAVEEVAGRPEQVEAEKALSMDAKTHRK